jgi:hypothetical protein
LLLHPIAQQFQPNVGVFAPGFAKEDKQAVPVKLLVQAAVKCCVATPIL